MTILPRFWLALMLLLALIITALDKLTLDGWLAFLFLCAALMVSAYKLRRAQ